MTMVPRTGPFSASSARATTSWYQRGKSAARLVSAPLDPAPWGTPSTVRGARSAGGFPPMAGSDLRDADLGGVGVVLLAEQLPAVRLGLGRCPGVGGRQPGVHSLGDQLLGFVDQGTDHVVLGDDPHDLAPDEQVPLALARRDAEVGAARLAGPVHH